MFTDRNASKPRPIIVRFKSYRTKKELYGSRKSLKSQNMSQIFQDAGIVYINENSVDKNATSTLCKSLEAQEVGAVAQCLDNRR